MWGGCVAVQPCSTLGARRVKAIKKKTLYIMFYLSEHIYVVCIHQTVWITLHKTRDKLLGLLARMANCRAHPPGGALLGITPPYTHTHLIKVNRMCVCARRQFTYIYIFCVRSHATRFVFGFVYTCILLLYTFSVHIVYRATFQK